MPGLDPRLPRLRHSIESPPALARISVVGIDETADTIFSAGRTDDDEVLHRQWRDREAVAFFVIDCYDVPDDVPGFRIERHYMRVECPEKHLVAQDRKSSIHPAAARSNVPWQLTFILPDRAPAASVQGEHTAILGR